MKHYEDGPHFRETETIHLISMRILENICKVMSLSRMRKERVTGTHRLLFILIVIIFSVHSVSSLWTEYQCYTNDGLMERSVLKIRQLTLMSVLFLQHAPPAWSQCFGSLNPLLKPALFQMSVLLCLICFCLFVWVFWECFLKRFCQDAFK